MSESREYLRVHPSSQSLDTEAIPRLIESLHKLTVEDSTSGITRLLPGDRSYPPQFEFLAISDGADEPVEFYFGTDGDLTTLADRLESMYPGTFDIEQVEVDVAQRLIHPVEYPHEEFVNRLDSGSLHYTPDETDLVGGVSRSGLLGDGGLLTREEAEGDEDGETDADENESTPDPTTVEYSNGSFRLDDARQGADLTALSRPTLTDDGTVLARPPISDLAPMGVRWHGVTAERKQDWMMTIADFYEQTSATADDSERRVPLATVIDHLVEAEAPIAFQVVFQRKEDWSPEAWQRKHDIKHNLDTWLGKAWDFIEPTTPEEHELSDRDERRLEQLDDKQPKRTFTVNVRAVAIPSGDETEEQLDTRLDALSTGFDALDGTFYEFSGYRLRGGGIRQKAKEQYARNALKRLLDRELVTGGRKTRFDFTFNASELANLITVPSGENLSAEGARGTRAKQQARTPPPEPPANRIQEYDTGINLGPALDSNGHPRSNNVRLPPTLQKRNILRCGPPGHGKTVGMTNDALSAYADTDGPTVIFATKGGGFAENYMRAHAAQFGFDNLRENVLYFPVHDVLPGISFFDITSMLGRPGFDRSTAAQHKADHYEEILKLTMGADKYEKATVGPTLIKHAVKAMYDEEHGLDNGRYRESTDVFSHAQLRQLIHQLWQAGPPEANPDRLPQSSDRETTHTFEHLINRDAQTFSAIMGGVDSRMAYITEDVRLRQLFDNTTANLDFHELLHDDQVVIFDLGHLLDNPSTVLTGALLTSLYDAIQESYQGELATKPDDYVINLFIDEAASVVGTNTISELLSRGREFNVSLELATQFPEQILESSNRETYLNTLRNTGTKLIGNIRVDDELAQALAHEDMDTVEFRNRLNSLANDEWFLDIPSKEFTAPDPNPFYVEAPPVPAGHPESDNPFTDDEEGRFQDVLAEVEERTRTEFSVEETAVTPADVLPDQLRDQLGSDDGDLGRALAYIVRTVQLREGVREENGLVSVEAVDTELRRVYADAAARVESDEEADVDFTPPDYDTLAEVRERSPLLAADIDTETESLVVGLTDAGEQAVAPDTGEVEAAGGEEHDDGVYETEQVLTAAGFNARVVTQDRSEQPDGRATHPDLDDEFVIEVETTTPSKPAKVLTNLRKAQDEEAIPLFVVRPEEKDSYWAERIENILHPPVRVLDSGETRLYTFNEQLEVQQVRSGQQLTAVRPAMGDDDARKSLWQRDPETGDAVLSAEDDGEYARIQRVDTATDRDVPAVYTYDPDVNQYVVLEDGTTHTYDSKEAFEAEWVPIKEPFIPERELPVPDYTRETYAIVILPEGGEPVVYEEGETAPLETLIEDSPPHAATPQRGDRLGHAALASAETGVDEAEDTVEGTPTQDNEPEPGPVTEATAEAAEESEPANNIADLDKEEVFGVFVDQHISETDDDSRVPKQEVYSAYKSWAAEHGLEIPTNSSISKQLNNHVDIERSRVRIDGDLTRVFTGITLDRGPDSE